MRVTISSFLGAFVLVSCSGSGSDDGARVDDAQADTVISGDTGPSVGDTGSVGDSSRADSAALDAAGDGRDGATIADSPSDAGGASFPCDIAAAGGTPCVAAYSLARPLFASYSGPLFKLQRASDSATKDIGIVGGLADAATADAFCVGTTCRYVVLYEQTTYHLDAVNTVRSDSSLILHPPLYGTKLVSGRSIPYWYEGFLTAGSRANSAWGNGAVPVGAVPATVYSLAGPAADSGLKGGCCYDFGIAEATIADTGNGHMFTLNLEGGRGMDLENGGMGAGVAHTTKPFVALGKTDGVSTITFKSGDADGALVIPTGVTSKYCTTPFTLRDAPLSCFGYGPFHHEGGITLSCGGDGSGCQPVIAGEFIEGVIIAAQTSDATDDAIQKGINALFGP